MKISSATGSRPVLPDLIFPVSRFDIAIDKLITDATNTSYALRAELCAKKIAEITSSYEDLQENEKQILISDLASHYLIGMLKFFMQKEGLSWKQPVDLGMSVGVELAFVMNAEDLGVWSNAFQASGLNQDPLFSFGASVCFPDPEIFKEKFKLHIAESDKEKFNPAINEMLDTVIAIAGQGRQVSVVLLMFTLADFLNQTSAQKVTGITGRAEANALKNVVTPVWLQALSDVAHDPVVKNRIEREAGFAYMVAGDNLFRAKDGTANKWLVKQFSRSHAVC